MGEAAKMGFTRCLAPAVNADRLTAKEKIAVVPVATVAEAMDHLF